MAYRRKQTMARSATFVEDHRNSRPPPPEKEDASSTSSLAAQAIRASALHRESSLSSAYGDSAFTASSERRRTNSYPQVQDVNKIEYTSIKNLNDNEITNSEGKNGFWGVLARKAKTMLDENDENSQDSTNLSQPAQSRWSYERLKKQENPTFQKGSEALKDIGGKIRKSIEEGWTMVENRSSDIIQETKKLQIRRKNSQNNELNNLDQMQVQISQSEQENQLKASRDVANAMAAKAKLLLRELKTVKADLAFAKLRCSQLEEENKVLREGHKKDGPTNEDDDLIRLQLETLLAEKGRLAHENSFYARENRFLREIVDFHQFNTHDVVSLDEEFEEDNDNFALDISPLLHDLSKNTSNNNNTLIQTQNSDVLDEVIGKEMETPVVEKEVKNELISPVEDNHS